MDYFTACMSQPLSQHCSTQNSPWAHPAICIPRDGACTLRRPRRIGGRRMSRSRPTRAAPPQPPNQPARAYTPRPLPTAVLASPPHHTHTLPAQRRPPRSKLDEENRETSYDQKRRMHTLLHGVTVSRRVTESVRARRDVVGTSFLSARCFKVI